MLMRGIKRRGEQGIDRLCHSQAAGQEIRMNNVRKRSSGHFGHLLIFDGKSV